jgi:hypothetical protein
MGGLQSLSRNFAEDRNLLQLLGFEPRIIQPLIKLHFLTKAIQGHVEALWLRNYTTNQQVVGSIPDGVIGIFQ